MARACLAISTLRSSVWLSGPVPRIHRLPSSSSGMNSRPSVGSKESGAADQRGHHEHGRPAVLQAQLQLPEVARLDEADQEVVPDRLEVLEEATCTSTGVSVMARTRAPAREKA